jgi:hypothetical protein
LPTVAHLREGWYGNYFKKEELDPPDWIRTPVNCAGLVAASEKKANEIFIPMCADLGLSGEIGSLEYTPTGNEGVNDFPIDMVVEDLAQVVESEELED